VNVHELGSWDMERVKQPTPMSVFLRPLCASWLVVWMIFLAVSVAAQTETFLEKVLRIAGISATPSQQKGPGDERDTGDIWVVTLSQGTRQRLTRGGGYRSPVFALGGEHILALKGYNIVRIPMFGGEAKTLYAIPGALKLVGSSKDDQDTVLLLTEDADDRLTVGLLTVRSGQITTLTYNKKSKDDQRLLIHLKGWERVYDGTTLYVKEETKQGMGGRWQWTDVYLKRGDQEPMNLSKCDGIVCGQPSLSPDSRQVVFIKVQAP